jgi:hypothetical protein
VQDLVDAAWIEFVRSGVCLHFAECRVGVSFKLKPLVNIEVLDPHRFAEQAYIVDDPKRVFRFCLADLPVTGMIESGEDIDARISRSIQDAGDFPLPPRSADPAYPFWCAMRLWCK